MSSIVKTKNRNPHYLRMKSLQSITRHILYMNCEKQTFLENPKLEKNIFLLFNYVYFSKL